MHIRKLLVGVRGLGAATALGLVLGLFVFSSGARTGSGLSSVLSA